MTSRFFGLTARGAALVAYAFAMLFVACSAAVAVGMDARAADAVASGGFEKKSFKIEGGWRIETKDDGSRVLRFDDAFSTKNGPDLKVFLSPASIAAVNGKTAVDGSVNLGVLKSNTGAQEYLIPADLDLNAFSSVLVHCEAYAKLWGGADLR